MLELRKFSMIKIIIVILFTFNLLACEPVQLASQKKESQKKPFICLSSQNQCDINSEFGRFNIQFSGQVEQGRIKTELPFQVQLKFDMAKQGYQLKNVTSYLEGKSMFMGKVPVFFKLNEKNSNVMIAETLLANCSEEIMTWRLWLQIDIVIADTVKQQSVFIDFESERL